jgi:hypothetical protein
MPSSVGLSVMFGSCKADRHQLCERVLPRSICPDLYNMLAFAWLMGLALTLVLQGCYDTIQTWPALHNSKLAAAVYTL